MTPSPLFLAANPLVQDVVQVTHTFGINLPNLLAQMLSFSVVAFVLWRFAFKPVIATLDERQRRIASGLIYAEEMKAKLDAAQRDAEAQHRAALAKAHELLTEAQRAAKEYAEQRQREAMEQAGALVRQARETIELEKRKMLAEARTEVARLVVATTQRVLAKELSELERERYNAAAARELAGV
jgi:F-type H+-transporting ATPase subunit b